MTLTHLQRLEAESIHIMREVVAECENPVMLYSIGKDSAVMLHLAMKAFYPAKPPFPLLHVDTTWKFREMIKFRDETVSQLGLKLIVYINQKGMTTGIELGAIYRGVMPYLASNLCRLAVLLAFPVLSLALPQALK